MRQDRCAVGTKHKTNEGYEIEVIEKIGWYKRRVRFENGYEVVIQYGQINLGKIKNPYHPSVRGVGYLGVGEYKAKIDGKQTPEYIVWQNMIKRCYDEKFQEKQPTYKSITVCDEWKNFQNFAKWCNDSHPKIEGVKFQLDKDLLQQDREDKIYSPETCIFLPYNVNLFLANKLSNNTSGYVGACWDKYNKKWHAQIMVFCEGKVKNLGLFPTPELASEAYQKARVVESEKVKSYLRELNYLPEYIIQLIK